MSSIDDLFEESGLTIDDLADRSGLTVERLEAIVTGRWTPSPEDRSRLAAAFDREVSDIAWGHTMDPRNIRYRRFGMRGDP
jgi:transcriptional regulator with XRE-family HTH domain